MPSSLVVSDATNLSWVLTSNTAIVAGDCLTMKMTSPYTGVSASTYASFSTKVPPVCKMQSGHTVTCDVLDSQTMRMNFTASSKELKLIGATTNSPFTNPFSSRKISSC